MRTPQDEPADDEMVGPTVSTAPTSSTAAAPPTSRWWHWDALPDHLGRARTSTVILSVLFLAVFTLYLNVRPDEQRVGTTPAGGGSDVQEPAVPSEPEPEPTTEPAPTTGPDDVEEGTETPSTAPSRSPSSTGSSEPTRETSSSAEPTRTSEPTGGSSEPTGESSEPDTPDATTSGAP